MSLRALRGQCIVIIGDDTKERVKNKLLRDQLPLALASGQLEKKLRLQPNYLNRFSSDELQLKQLGREFFLLGLKPQSLNYRATS